MINTKLLARETFTRYLSKYSYLVKMANGFIINNKIANQIRSVQF